MLWFGLKRDVKGGYDFSGQYTKGMVEDVRSLQRQVAELQNDIAGLMSYLHIVYNYRPERFSKVIIPRPEV